VGSIRSLAFLSTAMDIVENLLHSDLLNADAEALRKAGLRNGNELLAREFSRCQSLTEPAQSILNRSLIHLTLRSL
jgi:hypothetical protein